MLNTTMLLIGVLFGFAPDKDFVIFEFNEVTCFIWFLAPIMFRAGVMLEKDDLLQNWKLVLARALADNFATLAFVSLAAYYFLPKLGFDSLSTTDYLAIGAIFIPNSFIFQTPADPYPLIEPYDDQTIMLGEGSFGIASSVMLLKLLRDLNFSTPVNVSNQLFFIYGYLSYVIVTSSLLGLLVAWVVSFRGWIAKYIISKLLSLRLSHPNALTMFFGGATLILFIPATLIFILAEYLNLSGSLCVFFYGVGTAHYIIPKDIKNRTLWREDIHCVSRLPKVLLYAWVGQNAVKMNEWSYIRSRLGTFLGATAVLIITVIFGKVISVCTLSQWWAGNEKIVEETTDPVFFDLWELNNVEQMWAEAKEKTKEYKTDALLFKRWRISKIETQVMMLGSVAMAVNYMRVVAWGSAILPSVVTYALTYNQFGKSDDFQRALLFVCMVSVYLFTTLVIGLGKIILILKSDIDRIKYDNAETEEGHQDYVSIPMEREQDTQQTGVLVI